MKTLWTSVLAIGLVSGLVAQNQPVQNEDVLQLRKKLEAAANDAKKNVAFNWQTAEFVSGQLISGPPVKGAPYSAEAVNESIQTLADGNRIVQRTTAMQYRDNDGRERREETSAMGAIFITDPVAAVRYTLHPETKTAEKGPPARFDIVSNGGRNVFYYSNAGTVEGGVKETVRGAVTVAVSGTVAGAVAGSPGSQLSTIHLNGEPLAAVTAGRSIALAEPKVEDLGTMYVEGVQAQGTRTTITIPAGDIGNDRPINIVDERWISPDLQMTVMTKHSDPRSGETNFRLSKINRSIPPPYLFELPSDYTVNAGGGRGAFGAVRVVEPRK